MNCAQVAENLPWYLNRTLEGVEQQETQAHLAQCPECQRQLEETIFAAAVHQQHVPTEALIEYVFDPAALSIERGLFERHLAACRECAEQLSLLEESRRLMDEPEQATSDGGSEGGKVVEFQPRPRAIEAAPSSSVSGQDRLQPTRSLRLWQYGAIAASIAGFAALGGGWWNWQQARTLRDDLANQQRVTQERLVRLEAENQQLRETASKPQPPGQTGEEIARLQAQIKELTTPQVNVPVLEVYPQEMAERSQRPAVNQVSIPSAAKVVTLILNSQSATIAPSYSLDILDAQNRAVWSSQGLQRHATGDYTISVPAALLPPGNYLVNIYGRTGSQRTKIESYRLRINQARQ